MGRMLTMEEAIIGVPVDGPEADLILFIEEADDDLLDACMDEEDADRLEALGALLEMAASGPLTADQIVALEGLRDWASKKKAQVASKIPSGAKVVFGKIVKGGKVIGKAAGKGAVAAGHGAVKAAHGAVKAKRAVHGAAYGFTKAGKEAKAAAHKVAAAKGRAAGKAAWAASKGTFKKAVKSGESHSYAAGQAKRAGEKVGARMKKVRYGTNEKKPQKKPKQRPKGNGQHENSMRTVFANLLSESMSRHAEIYKANNGSWYLELADEEYGEWEDAYVYGPFGSERDADRYLDQFSNPGGMSVDDSGKRPPPKKSPNGKPVQSPRRNRW